MSGPVIDRYEILGGLGRGAMGSVYRARDIKIGREVAVKVLEREFAQSNKHRARFEREARAIAALRHPNIVEIFDFGGSPDQHLYLVMELIHGPHVGRLCREHGPFCESVLAAVGLELAAALEHAHAHGIIHRDLKPENVFIDRGRLVLADFGIVKAIASENPLGAAAASPRTDVIGTPGFMAPEQLAQEPLDGRTDLFSFGALLYFLATNRLPFTAESPYALVREFRDSRPTPLGELRRDFSDLLVRLVHDCLFVEPSLRPPDATTVHRRLRLVLNELAAGDAREILAAFERDPSGFRTTDTRRVVGHLLSQLKIAVRDGDAVRVDTIRNRIGILDPGNDDAQRVTGTERLVRAARRRRALSRWRNWVFPAVLAGLVTGSVVTALVVRGCDPTAHSTTSGPSQAACQLVVRATERTRVLIDGVEVGQTPDFPATLVASGHRVVEFISEKNGSLLETVNLPAGENLMLIVDWKRGVVRQRRTEP